MNAFQKFQTFSLAVRTWCWLIAIGIPVNIIALAYLNLETPYTLTQNGNTVPATAAQVNGACQTGLGSFTSRSMSICRQAQGLEQMKAGFAWGAVLAVIVLAVLLAVFWNRPPGPGGQQRTIPGEPSQPGMTSQPGFYEDPTARYARRYFDGREWTSRVSAGLGAPEQADKAWDEHPIITAPGD